LKAVTLNGSTLNFKETFYLLGWPISRYSILFQTFWKEIRNCLVGAFDDGHLPIFRDQKI